MFGRSAPPPHRRPEHELILCCTRTVLAPERAARLRTLAQEKLDWLSLVAIAAKGRVEPLLYWHLSAGCRDVVPPIWIDFLQRSFERNVRRNLYVSGQLLRILDSFEASGIRGIPYKGPTLAALAYGNLALRASGDLDILVRQRDVPKARELLLALGCSTDLAWMGGAAGRSGGIPGEYLFSCDHGRVLVELHPESTSRYLPAPLNVDCLETRLEAVPLGGRRILTFSPEDLLTILCVHGAKHFWDRLQWIVDIAELAESPRGLNWDLAIQRAGEMQSQRMLFLGLKVAHDLVEANLPEEVLRQIEADRPVQSLAARACALFFRDDNTSPDAVQRLLFRIRTRDKLGAGLRYSLWLATTPTEEDWSRLRLPAPVRPLYAVLRPIHLLRKYGLGIRRRPTPDLAPFVPTPGQVVERMLELAEVTSSDILYDLGCGNGQIVVTAAKRYGVRCVGVELDPRRIAEAKAHARREGVEHLVTFLCQDAKSVDVTQATVVTLYLTYLGNMKLREQFERLLRPGTRVVSRDFDMPGWVPEKTESVEVPGIPGTTLYLWRMRDAFDRSSASPMPGAPGDGFAQGHARAVAGGPTR